MIIIMFVHGKFLHLIELLVKPIWTNPPLNQVTLHTLGPFNILGQFRNITKDRAHFRNFHSKIRAGDITFNVSFMRDKGM